MKLPARTAMMFAASLLLLCFVPALRAASRADAETSTGVQKLTERFLTAFEDLDLEQFMACFASDATVFFPLPEPPQRFNGKNDIREHFQQVFAAIRKSSASTKPPFHQLNPEDLQVKVIGAHVAVVTLHLRNSERIARRTLVVTKVGGSWLISHLHASNVAVVPGPKPAPGANSDAHR